jgi:hypothetical protein
MLLISSAKLNKLMGGKTLPPCCFDSKVKLKKRESLKVYSLQARPK